MILRSEKLLESHAQRGLVNRETVPSVGGPGVHDRNPHRSTDLPQDLGHRHPRGIDRDERRVIHNADPRLGARHGGRMARHQRDTEKDGPGSVPHWVRTATLVDPCVTAPASLNRTKIRLVAGANGTVLVPVTKMPKVGASFALMVVTTGLVVGMVGFMHCPVEGSV